MTTPNLRAPGAAIVRRPVAYTDDAAALFAALGGTTMPDSVLLESADITSREGLQSVGVVAGAARITCVGTDVTVTALTTSGVAAVARLSEQMADYVASSPDALSVGSSVVFSFPPSQAEDERKRLTDVSSILPLRLLQSDAGYVDEFLPFIAGGFAFDYLETFEQLPAVGEGPNAYPDYQFLLAEIVLRIDHRDASAELVGVSLEGDTDEVRAALSARLDDLAARISEYAASPSPQADTDTVRSGTVQAVASATDKQFRASVAQLQNNIYEGDIYQVVPARAFTIDCPDAFAAYRSLKSSNPSPYMFYVRGEHEGQPFELFGASPESNLKYTHSTRQVELYPVAGTRPRGTNPDGSINDELDIRMELELRTDAKEIAEHAMLVDLARNDLARVATPATRRVANLLLVDRYSRVMHLVSRVTARLADDLDALDAYRACMNMGTLTGAPKIRATQLLREVEGTRRGSYGGAIGYLSGSGDMDTCIVIRSAFVRDGVAVVHAGAGVVRDSQPQAEADETVHKAYAVLSAIGAAQNSDVEVVR